jgi:hypothetical protein
MLGIVEANRYLKIYAAQRLLSGGSGKSRAAKSFEKKRKESSGKDLKYRQKEKTMNPQIQSEKPIEMINNLETATTEQDTLAQSGFLPDEIVSLLWLRQWYQNGGSDRVEVVRRLEFLKLMVTSGKIEL